MGEGYVTWGEEGSQAMHEGGSREYKAHGLTTISGCVMMGMGGESSGHGNQARMSYIYVISKWGAV